MKKYSNLIIVILTFIILIVILFNKTIVSETIINSFYIWFNTLVPSMLLLKPSTWSHHADDCHQAAAPERLCWWHRYSSCSQSGFCLHARRYYSSIFETLHQRSATWRSSCEACHWTNRDPNSFRLPERKQCPLSEL